VVDAFHTEVTTPAPCDVVTQATFAIADSRRVSADAVEELAAWESILRAA
jgi:hypothetical protein